MIRWQTKADLTRWNATAKRKQAAEVCQKKIQENKLDMKLVDVEYTLTATKSCFTLQRMAG